MNDTSRGLTLTVGISNCCRVYFDNALAPRIFFLP